MTKLVSWLQARSQREEGVTIVEYGVTVALVSLVLAGILVATGTAIMNDIQATVTGAI